MAEYEHLTNAPIVEAVIDFRVKLLPNFQQDNLVSLKETLKDKYPKEKKQNFVDVRVDFKNDLSSSNSKSEFRGYILRTEDEKEVIQIRIDGFTYSRLKPYTEWLEIVAEAKRGWDLYNTMVSPEFITRIAVRYINHIELPLSEEIAFDAYLKTAPIIPDKVSPRVASFFNRTVINYESKIKVHFIQAFEFRGTQKLPIILLDIDAYKAEEIDPNDSGIWPSFEKLREIKNDIFFNSITNKTKEMFK